MNGKKVLRVIGLLAVVAAVAMYFLSKDSSHLAELKTTWWIPLPLALVCFLAANRSTNKPSA